jgi:hypothetical protein
MFGPQVATIKEKQLLFNKTLGERHEQVPFISWKFPEQEHFPELSRLLPSTQVIQLYIEVP